MPKAARLNDPIGHSPTMNWLLKGLLIGAAVAAAGVLIVVTGGLAAPAIPVIAAVVAGTAAAGAGVGELMSTMSWAPKETAGAILGACSANVFTNSKPAARAHLDVVLCSKHPGPPVPVATGSGNVYINSQPAARQGDKTGCGGDITDGSGNVFIGGGTQQTDAIHPEDLVPGWVHAVLLTVGVGSAFALASPVVATLSLAGSIGLGYLGNWLGGKLFGKGSDGQKWFMLGGSVIGGILGAKGGIWLDKNYAISAQGLGLNFKSVRLQLDEMYTKAPAAKAEIDTLAESIAEQTGGRVAKAPLKERGRALEKAIKYEKYGGDASDVKDIARNTIVLEQSQYNKAVALLKKQGARINNIDSASDPMGYSGTKAIMKTKAGIRAEIEVNTPEMIYAKETPEIAREKYADLVSQDENHNTVSEA